MSHQGLGEEPHGRSLTLNTYFPQPSPKDCRCERCLALVRTSPGREEGALGSGDPAEGGCSEPTCPPGSFSELAAKYCSPVLPECPCVCAAGCLLRLCGKQEEAQAMGLLSLRSLLGKLDLPEVGKSLQVLVVSRSVGGSKASASARQPKRNAFPHSGSLDLHLEPRPKA